MSQINITNGTITYKHQVIKTSNISSIDLKKHQASHSMFLIIAGIVAGLWGLGKLESDILIGLLLIGGAALCFWLNSVNRKPSYFLIIQTNAGKVDLFHNEDYKFMNGIRLKIQEAMDVYAAPMNVTFNTDNKTIINNPTGNISITNVSNYQGLSEEDKKFITNSFEPALSRIQQEVAKTNNEEIRRNFEMLKQELKSSKPRKSILEAAWTVFSNMGTLSELAGTIEKGINMF